MRVSMMSPRLSVERNAAAPIGKPSAFTHSPRRTSIGTSTVARPTVTLDAKTRWIGSAIGDGLYAKLCERAIAMCFDDALFRQALENSLLSFIAFTLCFEFYLRGA